VVKAKPSLPVGHGELLARPEFGAWADLMRANRDAAARWDFTVAGRTAAHVRALARREALDAGAAFSARIGTEVDAPGSPDQPIVATGHQPDLYHPGVWIKDFLLQRLADETGASAVDVIVDSDAFEALSVSSPCLRPGVHRCTQYLAITSRDACYACTAVPSLCEVDDWMEAVSYQLESLPASAIESHFAQFAEAMKSARGDAHNLAEFTTFSRRRYEAAAGTRYLELPATRMGRTEAFAAFVVEIALGAERFHAAYNGALADYRAMNKTRSAAQPFPDLERDGHRFELPLWLIDAHERQGVWCEHVGGEVLLLGDDGRNIATLPSDPEAAIAVLHAADATLAPKALALTLFVRAFVCDLFIHGVGGGSYDQVTDDVFRRYFGVEPPAFSVASITMYLPLGMHIVTDEEVSSAREQLNRLAHNPDALLGEVEFDSAAERTRALDLAAEKATLVTAIAAPGADKKALGIRIREVNADLGTLLAPLRQSLEARLASLESQQAASEILTDRTYALCFWSPLEVADKAR